MPRARSGPSPSQTYEGRKTPNRPTSLMCAPSLVAGLSGPGTRGRASRRRRARPRACPRLAKIRSDASISAARPASMSSSVDGVDQALRLAHGERAARGDLLADRRRARRRASPGRHDLVDEADPLGLVGVDDPAGQDQLLRPRRPDDRAAGAACRRRPGVTAEAHLGQAELARAPTRSGGRSTARAPGRRRARCPRSRRSSASAGSASRAATPSSSAMPLAPPRPALRLELADVRARRERPLAAPGHDDRADIAGGGRPSVAERRVELVEQLAR